MTVYLVCPYCQDKVPHIRGAVPEGCSRCGSPRYAENEKGEPIYFFTAEQDVTSWAAGRVNERYHPL